MLGLRSLPAETGKVRPSHVVDEDRHNVGSFGGGRRQRNAQQQQDSELTESHQKRFGHAVIQIILSDTGLRMRLPAPERRSYALATIATMCNFKWLLC